MKCCPPVDSTSISIGRYGQRFLQTFKSRSRWELSLQRLWPGVAARCRRVRGMGGQDGLRADWGKGCLLRNVMGTFIGMSESRKGITSGAETAYLAYAFSAPFANVMGTSVKRALKMALRAPPFFINRACFSTTCGCVARAWIHTTIFRYLCMYHPRMIHLILHTCTLYMYLFMYERARTMSLSAASAPSDSSLETVLARLLAIATCNADRL